MSKITYTFAIDFPAQELRGKTLTGGEFCRADGKWQEEPDAVNFGKQTINGSKVILKVKIAGKPELEAALAAHNAENTAVQDRLVAMGWPQYQAAQRLAINAAEDYDTASEHGYPVREAAAMRAADDALEVIAQQYPLAAAYAKAAAYSYAANDLKASAGNQAMRAIEQGADPLQAVADMSADWSAAAAQAVYNN